MAPIEKSLILTTVSVQDLNIKIHQIIKEIYYFAWGNKWGLSLHFNDENALKELRDVDNEVIWDVNNGFNKKIFHIKTINIEDILKINLGMSPGYRYKRGPYDGQRIVNIYCGNCLLASYNNLKIAITKNKKLETITVVNVIQMSGFIWRHSFILMGTVLDATFYMEMVLS